MKKLNSYLKEVRANGRISFTTKEAIAALEISDNALRCAVYKLKKEGDLISPAQGLYVIVPPEHQAMGCIPAEELIPILMKYWNIPYYVCLLSAADFHGASHQKPQVLQVMLEKQMKPLTLGKLKIEFIYKKSLKDLPLVSKTVPTGYLHISSPELTAMDLLIYSHRSGGLNPIATVLSELSEAIDTKALVRLMQQSSEKTWVQRLGLILENIDTLDELHKNKLIQVIKHYLDQAHPMPILLVPSLPKNRGMLNSKWGIFENTTIESD